MTVCRDGIEVLKETVPFEKSFGYVEKGSTLIYTNELMRIALAVSQGSFCEKYQMGFGPRSALGKSFFITAGALVVGITVSAYYNRGPLLTVTFTSVLSVTVVPWLGL